jgi:hypothetical protein
MRSTSVSLVDLVDGVAIAHGCLEVSRVAPAEPGVDVGTVGARVVKAGFTLLRGRMQRVDDDLVRRLGYPGPHGGGS